MGKIKVLLIAISLFIGSSVWANEGQDEKGQSQINILQPLSPPLLQGTETKAYIVYRDTNGQMAKTPQGIIDPWTVVKAGGVFPTGHTGFLIVNPDGSSYVVDTISKIGVRKTDLNGFSDGQAQHLWFFDTELSQGQVKELTGWLGERAGINPDTGKPKHPYELGQKGPNTYDCVNLVEGALEMLADKYPLERERLNLTPERGNQSEHDGFVPYEQLVNARRNLKEVKITDLWLNNKDKVPPQPTNPGNDHPDDYMGVIGAPILRESEGPLANVAVFYHGFPDEASGIINDSCWLLPDVELDIMKQYPAIVIPSGGFFGMDSSDILKYKLRKYVEDGGVLVCFAQQQGSEFSCLPGTISAYGWGEDQSCWQNAAYIDIDHPIFASQEDAILDAGIDGYFTQWPNDATILLRRTKNQMPAMLMYKYGSGTVIASTLYPDFDAAQGRSSKEEIRLINDLISYVEDINKEIPEYKAGDEINIPIKISYEEFFNAFNEIPTNATQVEFTVRNSDKKILATNILSLASSLAPDQSTQINFQTTCLQDKLGIFWINYTLKDGQGNVLKPETKGERFYVSKHLAGKASTEGLSFSITSPTEHYIYGDMATFTFNFYNLGTQTYKVRCKYGLWSEEKYAKVIDVPAQGATFTASFKVLSAHGLFATFYDENNKIIGNVSRAIWPHNPELDIKINTDKKIYDKGDKGTITLVLEDKDNKYNLSYNPEIKLKITDPFGNEVFATNTTLSISPNGSITTIINFPLFAAVGGIYLIKAEVYSNEYLLRISGSSFEILVPEINTKLLLPEAIISNSINPISFLLTNIGSVTVPSGTLTIWFKEPNGNLVFGSVSAFGSLSISGSITLSFDISIKKVQFGTWTLMYILEYGDKVLVGSKQISCDVIIKVDLDKSSYCVREEIKPTIEIINTGGFKQELQVNSVIDWSNVSIPTVMTLLPNQKGSVSFTVSIPATLTAGYHYGTVTLQLGTSTKYKQFSFYIPDAEIKVDVAEVNYSAGGR